MQPLSAVVTTGIYCRQGCPASPRPENVRRFLLPAAAEAAGFRACMRCRPYRAAQPAVAPVDGEASELVCRAVRLVTGGALDAGTEDDLGARLGVSARHLRRLFAAELGVTPDQLARSRRAHFARRLLDDTDLTITQIAFASGFGSVRQLNRACVQVFRETPTALRARRRVADRLVADGGLTLRLPFRGPLDWPAMSAYLAARAVAGVEAVSPEAYRRTIVVDGQPGVIEILPGPPGADHLLLRAHLPYWEGLIHLVERARRICNLDLDVDEAVRALAGDPVVGPLVAARPGLRAPGTWDPFEIGVRAIVGQQVSVRGATTLMGRLVERLGTPVPGLAALGLTHTFPAPEAVADADLDGLGLTTARARAIRAFAAATADGKLPLDRRAPLDVLVAALEGVAGVGPWTAQYVALRLGEPDAFPAGDLQLRAHAGRADHWRPWRAHAAVHIWCKEMP